ncbi:erythromycin esterase family protein [Prescottella subtropica]|uniref:erythromycin esterase family protein n=1 Tax=Prescottella subtropica TaxID=2545757 RepID=UPI0010FA55B5|nr:erythromycin esterase family protein [Prescottella subtropica]
MTLSLSTLARPFDTPTALARTVDALLAGRPTPPTLFALGEPTHGIAAFPALRNDLLARLVDRGFRSIALEIDWFAASVVDDYVTGGAGDLDTVLTTGFSHGFGTLDGNRDLVVWLRDHNAGRPAHEQVRFHGFDAPVEYAAAPSPRAFLTAVVDRLPAPLRPISTDDLDVLAGDDADWSNPDAMYDAAASIGGSDRARALRVVADDLADAVHRAGPALHDYPAAAAHARTAQGLLRYHAVMADPGDDRIAVLLAVRAEMMAENLLAIAAREGRRGPTLVFAHNAHLQRSRPDRATGHENAGTCVARILGDRYLMVATDGAPRPEPGTLQGLLAAATDRRTLFPSADLHAVLPATLSAGTPLVPGHIPLDTDAFTGTDAVVFVTDTDGHRQQYW